MSTLSNVCYNVKMYIYFPYALLHSRSLSTCPDDHIRFSLSTYGQGLSENYFWYFPYNKINPIKALPTALIGSYSKSMFEEIGRKVEKKNRKILWTCWYFLMALPWIFIVWASSLYAWVDVYGIPGKFSCLKNRLEIH